MTNTLRIRRLAFFALLTLATALMGAVIYVMLTEEPELAADEAFPEPVLPNMEKQLDVVFPERVRTHDLTLNRFVDRFFRICIQARYSDFRLMLSQRLGDPLAARRFESIFNALKQVRVLALDKLPPQPEQPDPAYLMTAEYDLEPHAAVRGKTTDSIRLLILREDGQWRIGPLSREQRDQWDRQSSNHDQPPGAVDSQSPNQGRPTSMPESTIRPNRPARIKPA